MDELKARPNIPKQIRAPFLHAYEGPFDRGWHVGHYRVEESKVQMDQDPRPVALETEPEESLNGRA